MNRYVVTKRGYFWNGVGFSVSPRWAIWFTTYSAAETEAIRLGGRVEEM